MSKTIEEIKDEVAIEYGWKSWKSCYGEDGITNTMIDEVAQRYAQSQTQELQEQNAELVEMFNEIYNDRLWGNDKDFDKLKDLITRATKLNKM